MEFSNKKITFQKRLTVTIFIILTNCYLNKTSLTNRKNRSLLNCAPCAPSRLSALAVIVRWRALPIINMDLTRPRADNLSCAVFLQSKGKICFVCALKLTIHTPSLAPLFYFTTCTCFTFFFFLFFFSFILSQWLHHCS